MKTTAALLLFALPAAGVSAAGAEERLIPFDEFFLSVPVTGRLNFDGLQLAVQMRRGVNEPVGRTGIEVVRSRVSLPDRTLTAEELAALMEALNAALKAQPYRREVPRGLDKSVFETAKVDDHTRVRMHRPDEGEVLFEPEETIKLKLALEQALVAEAWLKKLLTERTLPVQTAEAHPPKGPSPYLKSEVGKVSGEGLTYEVALSNLPPPQAPEFRVEQGLSFYTPRGIFYSKRGEKVKRMMEHVALALDAVGRKEAFTFDAMQDGDEGERGEFTVTANLETHKADVVIDPGRAFGRHAPALGSFAVAQTAAIRKLLAQGDAWQKWLTEHEVWFLEAE